MPPAQGSEELPLPARFKGRSKRRAEGGEGAAEDGDKGKGDKKTSGGGKGSSGNTSKLVNA
eukprot:6439118-Pyramimonas_sp.AAC.1